MYKSSCRAVHELRFLMHNIFLSQISLHIQHPHHSRSARCMYPEYASSPSRCACGLQRTSLMSHCAPYPQSCRGTDVTEVRYTPESLEVGQPLRSSECLELKMPTRQYDRRWGVADATSHRILTLRQVAKVCSWPSRMCLATDEHLR